MRTTLTIADDVAAQLARVRNGRKARLKDVINEALREGLKHLSAKEPLPAPFQTESVSLGRCLVGSIDDSPDAPGPGEVKTRGKLV